MTQSATPLRGGSAAVVDLMLLAATLLFVNGQTTARTIDATARLAGALGFRADLLPRWGELTATIDGDDSRASVVSASPLSVDMGKVAATLEVTDQLCDGHIDADGAQVALQAIQHRPPIALARFASLAAAGAAALGVIFGEVHLLGLIVIALSAGAGALLRRWLAGLAPTRSFSHSAPPCWRVLSARLWLIFSSARCSASSQSVPAWCWFRVRTC